MSELSTFQKALIAECQIRIPIGSIVYNGAEYYLNAPRLGNKINIPMEDIKYLVDNGYGSINQHGGFSFDVTKCEELYEDLLIRHRIPNPAMPGKMLDYCEFSASVESA